MIIHVHKTVKETINILVHILEFVYIEKYILINIERKHYSYS